MPNLLFVTVAIGIFSATSLTAKSQTLVNMERMDGSVPAKKSKRFIDGIEIKAGTVVVNPADIIKPPANTVTAKPKPQPKTEIETEPAAIETYSSLQFKYALLLDMDVESVSNIVLFDEIEKWWDTRYRYGGTTEKGIDCSAYTGTLLSDVYGLNVSRTSRAQYAESEKVDKGDLQQGDLVFFNTRRRGKGVSHVGLYLGNGYFTHAGSSTGVTISNLSDSYWSSKYIGGGRIAPAVTASAE